MPGSSSKKQSQRTKGNVRPSSSSHAAELLSSSGMAATGFVGFGQSPKYVPASSTLDDMDSSLDPEFRLVLRKLTKRDATTKIKGLQEFGDLCKEKTEDDLKAVLPFWPRTYSKMVMDVDYRVRETAQQAMATLVGRVRRNLAPYVKSLMGPWLLSQCDTYPTVASAANQAFQTAFPPAKQTEALSFCKTSVLEYVSENVLKHSALSLSDPKTTEPEDMENKYNRVITSSLLVVRKLLTALPANQMASLTQPITALMEDPKFWKHGKSKIDLVKSAMYSCLAGICQHQAELSAHYVNKMAPLILHNLDEKEIVIGCQLWEAVLSLINYVPDCWKHVNVQKAFWPNLKHLLESGCHGNAVVIAPNLLPLVSRMPCDLFPDQRKFYEDFFTSFRLGLNTACVQKSGSEVSATVRAYMECAQFIIKQSLATDMAEHLLHDQVLPVVLASLLEESSPFHKSPLYGIMGVLLTGLELSDSQSVRQSASQFWAELKETVEQKLTSSEEKETGTSFEDRVVYLVKCLFYPNTEMKQKTGKVTFGEVTEKVAENTTSKLQKLKLEGGAAPLKVCLCPSARLFVQDVTLMSFELAHKHFSLTHLRVFSQLLELDSSDETVARVIQCCHGDTATETTSHYFVFEICMPWLSKLQEDMSEMRMGVTHLIYIVCMFLSMLDRESVQTVLEKLYENCSDSKSEYILFEKLFSLMKANVGVKEWIQSTKFGSKMVSRTRAICDGDVVERIQEETTNTLDLLALVLANKDEHDEPVMHKDYIEGLLQVFQLLLQKLDQSDVAHKADIAVTFVAKAAHCFFSDFKRCLEMQSGTELLHTLFRVTLYNQYNITQETLEVAQEAWSVGVAYVVRQTGGLLHDAGILAQLATTVQDVVAHHVRSADMLSQVLTSVEMLLRSVEDSLPKGEEANPVYVAYCNQLMASVCTAVPDKVWCYLCVKGNYPFISSTRGTTTFPMQILFGCLYNCKLLKLTLGGSQQDCDNGKPALDWSDTRQRCLLDCIQGLSTLQYFMEQDTKVTTMMEVPEAMAVLSSLTTDLVHALGEGHRTSLWSLAYTRCEEAPSYVVCLKTVLSLIRSAQSNAVILELSPILDRCGSLSGTTVHFLHSTIDYLSPSNQVTMAEIMVARLLSFPTESITRLDGGVGLLSVISRLASAITSSANQDEAADLLTGALDQVLMWKEENEDFLIYNSNVTDSSDVILLLNAEISRFLATLVQCLPHRLTDKHWDFIMCSVVSWMQTCEESVSEVLNSRAAPVHCFTVSVMELVCQLVPCMNNKVAGTPADYPKNLLTEWNEFFCESVFAIVLPLYQKMCKNLSLYSWGPEHLMLVSICDAVSFTPATCIREHKLPALLVAGDSSPLPDNLQTLLNHVCPRLATDERPVQIAAFNILNSIISSLPEYDKEDKSVEVAATGGEEEEETNRSPPSYIMAVLDESSAVLEVLLCDLPIERCEVISEQMTQYHCTLAYLLCWKLLLQLFKSAPSDLRQEYAGYFQEHGYVDRLMYNLYRLMPNKPSKMFLFKPDMNVAGQGSSAEIQQLSCDLYQQGMRVIPAMVRQWWKSQDRKTAAYIDSFTTKYVSHMLCGEEIKSVQKTDVQLDNMAIKARPATREVVATYSLEEVTIEMVISLPQNYPLGNISVVSEKRVGVSGAQWEKWLLQLNIFLQHQNGNIMDGLRLWKNNIDKRFEGVDECMICFYVLHGTNFQLPRITCRTCKKKFHSSCLYKWFHTSHNCTCPLCRNVF